MFRKLRYDADTISYWIQHKNVFGIANLKQLTLNDIRNSAFYRALTESSVEMEPAIRDALAAFQGAGAFTDGNMGALADLWHRPLREIQSVVTALALPPVAIEAVRYVRDVQQICQTLGVEGKALQKLLATTYAGLQEARDVALGAFASKYPDEKARRETLEPYIDRINTLKRDALCDYIISRRDLFKFRDRSDLYAFFLLDTEMSGCFRTSRVVAAITSLQLYVHRCRMYLEQSDRALNPQIVDVKVNPAWIKADEWAWRQNYRVWQANRKVFLYPENYIEPELRDIKTPLFEELESTLLGGEEHYLGVDLDIAGLELLPPGDHTEGAHEAGGEAHGSGRKLCVDLRALGLVEGRLGLGAGPLGEGPHRLRLRRAALRVPRRQEHLHRGRLGR